jgi:hypothetical protein
MIGDLGALVVRAILEELAPAGTHFSAGGGHRGEFDVVASTPQQLILGEIKASPLIAFPVAAHIDDDTTVPDHSWTGVTNSDRWAIFIGAAETPVSRYIPVTEPGQRGVWPLEDIARLVTEPDTVTMLFEAWRRQLVGYRLFNSEDPLTRWHRFGCGNIESRDADGAVQLRVDNTKTLPGLDRTDDIKKGLAQVILFGRLKRGCTIRAIKTVLFGNLYAETHHQHYVRPIADAQLVWGDEEPLWLFDALIALSRNIINDSDVERLFGLPNQPYGEAELESEQAVATLMDGLSEAE